MFQKKDRILMSAVLLIAVVMGLIFHFSMKKSGDRVYIMVDGSLYGSYSMMEDQTIEVTNESGYNQIVIENGSVYMEKADCPDQYCVEHKAVSSANETIVCLPHKLVVEIHSETVSNEVDSVAR